MSPRSYPLVSNRGCLIFENKCLNNDNQYLSNSKDVRESNNFRSYADVVKNNKNNNQCRNKSIQSIQRYSSPKLNENHKNNEHNSNKHNESNSKSPKITEFYNKSKNQKFITQKLPVSTLKFETNVLNNVFIELKN